jgi:hypothetical protein
MHVGDFDNNRYDVSGAEFLDFYETGSGGNRTYISGIFVNSGGKSITSLPWKGVGN